MPRRDEDDFGYDPRPRRRDPRPGYGLGVSSLVCGITGVVVSILGGGPAMCAACCPLVMPFSWAIAAVGALLGVAAIVLGAISRSQGNRTAVPVGGIATGVVTVVLAAAAIVLPFVFVANMPAPPPNQPFQPQPKINPPRKF